VCADSTGQRCLRSHRWEDKARATNGGWDFDRQRPTSWLPARAPVPAENKPQTQELRSSKRYQFVSIPLWSNMMSAINAMIEKRFRVKDMNCRLTFRWSKPLQKSRWFAYIDVEPANEEGFETEEMAYVALTRRKF
jgi:hypothetical protein